MQYSLYKNRAICGSVDLPGQPLAELPDEGEILFLFRRPPLTGRETFAVTHPSQLTADEGPEVLTTAQPSREVPADLARAIAQKRVRAVNAAHPRWEELLDLPPRGDKVRVNLLALGDVGSTLAMGLKLLGGDVISTLGLCDVRENVPQRWEFELGQIAVPFPRVKIVKPEDVFGCDVFLFCASKYVPDVSVKTGDVRMAQYAANGPLVAGYGRMAREQGFRGRFWVVSDPVDQLCLSALTASNLDGNGTMDGQGLWPQQVRGFGLGVMNARAAYYAKKDARFGDFLIDGRTFGPHGEDLVVANSIARYDDALSRELTDKVAHANLEMRALGFKPFVAPALSSGALSVLAALRGEWHCSSVYMDGIFMGCKNRDAQNGVEIERLPLPEALVSRIRETAARLRQVETVL